MAFAAGESAPAMLLQREPHPLGLAPLGLATWGSACDDNEDDDEEDLAPQMPRTASMVIDSTEVSVGREAEGNGDGKWCCRCMAQAIRRRQPWLWFHGRCFICLLPGHHAADCRDPFRCSRCLENGH